MSADAERPAINVAGAVRQGAVAALHRLAGDGELVGRLQVVVRIHIGPPIEGRPDEPLECNVDAGVAECDADCQECLG